MRERLVERTGQLGRERGPAAGGAVEVAHQDGHDPADGGAHVLETVGADAERACQQVDRVEGEPEMVVVAPVAVGLLRAQDGVDAGLGVRQVAVEMFVEKTVVERAADLVGVAAGRLAHAHQAAGRVEITVACGEIRVEPLGVREGGHQRVDGADAGAPVAAQVDGGAPVQGGEKSLGVGEGGVHPHRPCGREVEQLHGREGEGGVVQRVVRLRFRVPFQDEQIRARPEFLPGLDPRGRLTIQEDDREA